MQTEDRSRHPQLVLESRPPVLFAALYDELPFPHLNPVQEVAFDLGVTAIGGSYELTGLVIRGYSGHQMLFEQRWPERIVRQKCRIEDLSIPEGTGIAVRSVHLQLHGFEKLSHVDVTAVARLASTEESGQGVLRIPVQYPEPETDLHFPVVGVWWAVQAGDWSDMHKSEVMSQPYAVDLVKLGPDCQIFQNRGTDLEDHASWDQPVYAAAGGKVAYVGYDMPDLAPGEMPDPRIYRDDPRRLLGNAVAISHGNGEFTYYGHLRQASLEVNYGEMVRRGKRLGRVGNSGQSPGPHLHFHVMNGPNVYIDQGLPLKVSHFWAGGQFFDRPVSLPTRMLATGPSREATDN